MRQVQLNALDVDFIAASAILLSSLSLFICKMEIIRLNMTCLTQNLEHS